MLVQGNNLWVPKRGRRRDSRDVREPGASDGRRPRRLELGRAVRRSEQRRHAGPVPGQRLRVGGRAQQLLVRLLGDRRRPQRDHRRRGELAGDEGPQPVRLPAEAGLDQRRRGPLHRRRAGGRRHRRHRRPRGRPGRSSATAACSTWSSPTSAARCCSTATRSRPDRHWIRLRAARDATASNRSAIGARVELHWNGQRAAAGGLPAASGFSAQNQRRLHFGLGARHAVERAVIRWPSGRSRRSKRPASDSSTR